MTLGVHAQAPTGGASGPVTTPARTTTSGSTVILLAVTSGFDTTTPVQDNKGNTWTLEGTSVSYSSGGSHARVYSCKNITGGAGHTFTTTPVGGGFAALIMGEALGVGASPTILWAGNSDATSSFDSGNISPNACTLFGGFFSNAPDGTETDVWGGSFASGDMIEALTDANTGFTGSMAVVNKASGTYHSSVTSSLAGSSGSITDTAVFVVSVETTGGGGFKAPWAMNSNPPVID